jgi:hypothetical protein
MQYHALICKFMGLWPSEKSLMWWIKTRWKPKGEVTLKLGSKGFFTTIFNLEEDRERVFQGGPYFFNSVGLYMRIWKENFSPKRKISLQPRYGSDCTRSRRSTGTQNPRGYREHSQILCQNCRSHPSRPLYLLCPDLCLPQCLQISASLNFPQI